eukprot:scaffold1410_cov242-Pinguiococcus_pyrenoidosus.AAC.12
MLKLGGYAVTWKVDHHTPIPMGRHLASDGVPVRGRAQPTVQEQQSPLGGCIGWTVSSPCKLARVLQEVVVEACVHAALDFTVQFHVVFRIWYFGLDEKWPRLRAVAATQRFNQLLVGRHGSIRNAEKLCCRSEARVVRRVV